MDGQLVRLTAADYEEALDFMNMVFSMNRRPANFLTGLPIMWERDDEHMGKHWAVKREGRIRAMLGVYPLPVVIAGMKLLFSTVGNVCTSRYEAGKGYMAALMALAMEELERQGMDAVTQLLALQRADMQSKGVPGEEQTERFIQVEEMLKTLSWERGDRA